MEEIMKQANESPPTSPGHEDEGNVMFMVKLCMSSSGKPNN